MQNVNDIVKRLNILYDYGEINHNEIFNYLIEEKFLKIMGNKLVITKKWISFSGKVSREEFISSLLCYYPLLLKRLLLKVYKEACSIGESGDGKALFEFVDSIPKFSQRILEIKNEPIQENEEIKLLYQVIFNGYPQYGEILSKLKSMQLAEDINDLDIVPIGKNPNENWIKGRRITSSLSLKKKKEKQEYTLIPYEYSDFQVENEIKDILSFPWKTFLIVLSMISSEYKVEGFDGVTIRPTEASNPYNEQNLEVYICNSKGNEVKVGLLNKFIYDYCIKSDLLLFPDKVPEVSKVVFELLPERKMDYKDGEYVINQDLNDLIYSKDIIIKNRSRKFKNNLKDYIEDLRKAL